LAYGSAGISGVIPQNAVLIFDVEVVKVANAQTEADIIAYLEENSLDAQRSETGLYYIIEEQGDGGPINENSLVTIIYEGTFLDGEVFDSSEEGLDFDLQNVIPGFAEGVAYFNYGGKGKLIIPPSLAYGEDGVPNRIPRNTVLVFDIDIQ
jgi:peptidylprolyl isomerase